MKLGIFNNKLFSELSQNRMSAAKKNLGGAYVPPGNLKSKSSL